jgi:hypothetical protein
MRKKIFSKNVPLVFGGPESTAPIAEPMDDLAEAMFVPAVAAAPEPFERPEERANNSSVQFIEAMTATAEEPATRQEAGNALPRTPREPRTPKVEAMKAPPPKSPSDMPGWARSAYWIAVPAAVLWAGCMAAFASGYQNPFGPFEYRPYPMAAFAGLCLLPAVFILLAAYAVRQGARLSVETRKARELAGDIGISAALAADQAGGAAEAVRIQVERATAAAAAAEHQLLDLRRALSEESDRLIEATSDAERRAQVLTQGLAREREEMAGLTRSLDGQVQAVSDAIAAQSRIVVEASDLAATQVQEAEAALAARATDLAVAAGEAAEAASMAGDLLSEQSERLYAVGETVAARVGGLQGALSQDHARLAALADSLREDQQHIAAEIEAQRRHLEDASAEAMASAEAIGQASVQSAGSLRELIATVAEQVGQLAALAESDKAAIQSQAQANLKLFTGVVAEERAALEAETRAAIDALAVAAADTRKAAIEQTEAARARVEELGESAFALGQKADQAFDARVGAAQRMIEQSAGLIDQAGRQSAERIEAGLNATYGALCDLDKLLSAIDAKVAALPEDARARAETVRAAVEQGIDDLTAAARKAAEETQAIDAVFQGRIKQNYQVLSEALRLMGQVAGAAATTAKVSPIPASTPIRAQPSARPAPDAQTTVRSSIPETPQSIRVPKDTYPAVDAAPFRGEAVSADAIGLRPRLKLTVDAPKPAPLRPAPVEAAEPPSRGDDNAWTWKDLLSSIDAPPMDDEVLAERLISEIEALGLDASMLLPLARIDEIAAVMQAGDNAGARDVVRNLAPSAVRRLSRRVLTDKVLRVQADRYLQRYQDLLTDSAKRDRDGFVTATLLGSDPGRAFLLFNAAVGELH